MAELLQRATAMKVLQVKDRTIVQPDCVYVIPPNKDMSILHGVLHLLDPAAPRGLRLPIDFFLPLAGAMTSRNAASASFFQAWAPTARWVCAPSRKRGA